MLVWAHELHAGFILFPTKDGKSLYMYSHEDSTVHLHVGGVDFYAIYSKHGTWKKVKISKKYKSILLSEKSLILKGYL